MTIQNLKFKTANLLVFCVALIMVFISGCETIPINIGSGTRAKDISIYKQYMPTKIDIMPLTEFEGSDGDYQLQVFVSVHDSFGSHIKAPAVFRFELYQYRQRSTTNKGRRITLWDDIDLTEPAKNNSYWRDFLRMYQFQLSVESKGLQASVLQVTATTANGKRLTAELPLKVE